MSYFPHPIHIYLWTVNILGQGLWNSTCFSLRAWSYLNAMFIFKQQHCHWWLTMTFVICSETYHCICLSMLFCLPCQFLGPESHSGCYSLPPTFPLPAPPPHGLFPNYIRISWYLFFFKDQLISLTKCLHSLSPTTCILNLAPSPLKGYLLV